jgi:hypothetical protein
MLLFTLEEFQVYRRAGQLEIVLAPPSSLLQGADKSQL